MMIKKYFEYAGWELNTKKLLSNPYYCTTGLRLKELCKIKVTYRDVNSTT